MWILKVLKDWGVRILALIRPGPTFVPSWRDRWRHLCNRGGAQSPYFEANRAAIHNALQGMGPDDAGVRADQGARMVANIAAVHAITFCDSATKGDLKPYKNCYDLRKHCVGDGSRRVLVDESLPVHDYTNTYFCAAELNGSGIRYYGDFCFVLRPTDADRDTLILERNSYDLVRSPLKEMIEAEAEHASQALKRKHFAQEMAGWWSDDLSAMAALKVLSRRPEDGRRLTTGHIAEGVLSDEDYIEVLRQGSFGPKDLEEVRITVTDASLQSRIVEQSCHGNAPGLDAQLWCRRRYQAEQSLRARNVRVRVVTTLGRTRQ